MNRELRRKDRKFDLVILSDIIEHIPNDGAFVELVAKKSRHALVKIPIENTLYHHVLQFLGKSEPIGESHPSGHLHEYTIKQAFDLLGKIL